MYTQAILLKAKRAKRKSARIEDDVAESVCSWFTK